MADSIRVSARPLFKLRAHNMASNTLRHDGALGVRIVSSPDGGAFSGDRLAGTIAPGLANEWQLASTTVDGLAHVSGLITLLGDDGGAIFMKYCGRRSSLYGAQSYRVGIGFEAPSDGAYDWLNDVVAVAEIEPVGDDLLFNAHELLGREAPIDGHALAAEPLYQMRASGSVGERYKVQAPTGGRYLSIAEQGCETAGKLKAYWPAGFAWGAHRISTGDPSGYGMPFHIDLDVEMTATNGDMILQHYIGTSPRSMIDPSPDADRSWCTVAMFEAPASGEHAYLNGVVALGYGWMEANEANYSYAIWK